MTGGGKIRVGAVNYLNARPLVLGFEQGIAADRLELVHDVPSALADRMERGELQVALLPTIELARIPGLFVIPGLGISSRGPARSVLLVSRRPVEEVARVALDPESRTSNALAQVLFARVWGGSPEFVLGGPDLEENLRDADAAVRIGDKALFEPLPPGTRGYDLGEAWTSATGLPFVFAVWAAIPGVVDRELYVAFHRSRREGSRQIPWIGEDYPYRGKRHPEIAREYLERNIRYRLGGPEVKAMETFHAAASEIGLVPSPQPLRIAYFSETACHRATAAAARSGDDG